MKHIKKKYLFQKNYDKLKTVLDKKHEELLITDKDLIKKSKNKVLLVKTSKDIVMKAFPVKVNNGNIVIPIPDLSLVYFDAAYNLNILRKEYETKMYEKLALKNEVNELNEINEDATNEIYKYYGFASSCIILLFTSLESFINFMIPDNGEYKKETNTKTEIYNKSQIQRFINFNDKMKKVIPYFHKKDFFNKQTPTNQYIDDLKKVRDEIVHSKSESTFLVQETLMKKILEFKYEKTFDSIRKYMNFYKPGYIEDCDCDKEF